MFDFDLGAVTVPRGATREYAIPAIGVVLTLAPMTEANEAYFSAVLKRAAERRAAGHIDVAVDPESVLAAKKREVELMARHVLVGWRGVKNRVGVEVPFSVEAAEEFLLLLARESGLAHILDGIHAFATAPDNFTNAALAGAKVYAGNSSGG